MAEAEPEAATLGQTASSGLADTKQLGGSELGATKELMETTAKEGMSLIDRFCARTPPRHTISLSARACAFVRSTQC